MHVTWWEVLLVVLFFGMAIREWRSFLREARRLREVVNADGNSYRHSDAFANQRRSYKRKMWWMIPLGVVLLLLNMIGGIERDWGGVVSMGLGLWLLLWGVVAWLCLRILGPPARAVGS